MPAKVTVLMVHGLLSSGKTWDAIASLIGQDQELADVVNLRRFEYSTSLVEMRPTRRIPEFETVAQALGIFIETSVPKSEPIVVVAHSQGGLIVQRYLAQQLADGKGQDLQRISSVILLATPNSGSELLLTLRRGLLGRNPQVRDLRPLTEDIAETQRRILRDIVFAKEAGPNTSPIRIYAYAGETDRVVLPASARSLFPNSGVLPGDHASINKPASVEAPLYKITKARILEALSGQTTAPPRGDSNLKPPALPEAPRSSALSQDTIKHIAATLLEFEDLRDPTTRRQFVEFMPPYIRERIALGANARLDIVTLVKACARFEQTGREVLLASLEWIFPPEDPAAERLLVQLQAYWPDA
ncbi:alpha/beta fold hydrolase [Geodermatophilus sp. URMC 63]